MIFTSLLFATLPVHPPVPLDVMPLAHARVLEGRRVWVSVGSVKPVDFAGECTVIGCEDRPDSVERAAILRGNRTDVENKRVVVWGRLEVIDHPARRIGDAFVPEWTEVRVTE
jgi:hypothetical protein